MVLRSGLTDSVVWMRLYTKERGSNSVRMLRCVHSTGYTVCNHPPTKPRARIQFFYVKLLVRIVLFAISQFYVTLIWVEMRLIRIPTYKYIPSTVTLLTYAYFDSPRNENNLKYTHMHHQQWEKERAKRRRINV